MSGAILESIGLTLIHFVWQGAAIAAGLFVLLRLLRRAGHELRYALAAAALLAMAVVAPGTLVLLVSHVPDAGPAELAPLLASDASRPPTIVPWLAVGWALGVCVFATRFAAGWIRLRRLVGAASPAGPDWRERIDRLGRRIGLIRAVTVRIASEVGSPVLVGCWRPVILLPVSALTGLSAEHLESVILHEMAHVRRLDPLVHRLQLVVEALLFYHPAVWWVSRIVREEREFCCDALVVRLTGDSLGYARALTALESLRADHAYQVLASTGGSLMSRIREIVRPASRSPHAASSGASWAVVAGGLALGVVCVALLATPFVAGDRAASEPIAWMPAPLRQLQPHFVEASRRHGVAPDLLAIMTLVESGGNPDATSPLGARGLMQIMPATAQKIAQQRGIADFAIEQLGDPGRNIDFGAWYVAKQMAAFGGGKNEADAIELAAAAYNAGPGQLTRHLEEGAELSRESTHYSKLVRELWSERNETVSPAFESWLNRRRGP